MAITLDGTNGITSPDFEPSSSTTPTNGLFLPAANTVGLATGSTERLRIDSSGNLGLGVTPSAWGSGFKALQVGARGSVYAGSDASMRLAYNAYYDGTSFKRIAASSASQWLADIDGSFAWFQAGSSTAGSAISFTQAMTLDASGNLGIGTSSPSTYGQLSLYRASGDVEAAVVTGGANYATYRIQNSTNRYSMQIRTDVSNAWVLRDETNSANRLVVDTSGNLLVGTTSSIARLTAITSGDACFLQTTGSTATCGYAKVPGNTAYYWLWQNSAGSNIAYIRTTDGTTVTYNTGSDVRLKENITDSGSSLSKLNSIKVREFDWKSTGKKVEFGFIAQELNSVAPEAVSQGKDNSDGTIDVPWGVDNSILVPALVKAIQELTQRLEILENK